MSLTPLDIHNKEFSKRMRGYDEDEVNEFLDQIVRDFETLTRERDTLKQQVTTLQEKVSSMASIEDTLSKTIIIAQQTADEVKDNAKKESQLILKEAEKNAERIINESLMRARKIELEIEELKKRASVYRVRFKAMIEAQMELLQEETWNEVAPFAMND